MTISEVGEKYGITADTLRYYERIGHAASGGAHPGGIRDYPTYDISWPKLILRPGRRAAHRGHYRIC